MRPTVWLLPPDQDVLDVAATIIDSRDDAAAAAPDGPAAADAVVFDRVSLAFDDHIVLRDLSFTVPKGAMRILLGASGVGKSIVLKLILGLLRPDSGVILVNGQRVDDMPERDLLSVRGDIGMLFRRTRCSIR